MTGLFSFFQRTVTETGQLLSKTVGDVFSSWSGDVDPARLFGYGLTVWGAIQFYVSEAYITIHTKTFDTSNFAIGMASISGALVASAAGVWIKRDTENRPPPGQDLNCAVRNPNLNGFTPPSDQ